VLAVEIPILLLLLSTLVFRGRSADQLAYNPLDSAAQFRVACVLLGLLLGAFALLSSSAPEANVPRRLTTLPFRLFVLYVVVVFIGAPLSVNPSLTTYRGIELAAGIVVFLGALTTVGEEALRRIESLVFWFIAALIGSVWLGVLVFPDQAINHFLNNYVPINFQISGAYPSISANSVGTFGVILAFWSIARVQTHDQRRKLKPHVGYGFAAVGVVSVLAAQYRTGYVALLVGLTVHMMLRRRWALATILALGAVSVLVAVPSLVQQAQPYVLRGQTVQQARELSNRVDWWGAGLKVWRESPIIGRGLLTGTRFEVLARLGLKNTSTIHSTWVEALVGTGLLGLSLLALAYLVSVKRSFIEALRGGNLIPSMVLVTVGVRTITGDTFESFSVFAVLFLLVALLLRDPAVGSHSAHVLEHGRVSS
jgi:O-antigen ligase